LRPLARNRALTEANTQLAEALKQQKATDAYTLDEHHCEED
jgi:hypothetical protein